jgi:hypothetical protein
MAMGCIRSGRTVKGKVTTEIRYYLTTLTEVAVLASPAHGHLGIENKPHRVRPFGKIAREIGKTVRRRTWRYYGKITLNLLRLEPTEKYGTRKFSLNRTRLYASYEPADRGNTSNTT